MQSKVISQRDRRNKSNIPLGVKRGGGDFVSKFYLPPPEDIFPNSFAVLNLIKLICRIRCSLKSSFSAPIRNISQGSSLQQFSSAENRKEWELRRMPATKMSKYFGRIRVFTNVSALNLIFFVGS